MNLELQCPVCGIREDARGELAKSLQRLEDITGRVIIFDTCLHEFKIVPDGLVQIRDED